MSAENRYILRPESGGDGVELKDQFLVGRKESCDLVLKEGQPSRQHARFTIDAEGVLLTDLDSTNGTFVNGTRIKGGQRLRNGDLVAFDATRFRFEAPAEASVVDTGATVIRPIADLERTMIRSAADLQKELEAARPAAPKEDAPKKESGKPEAGKPPESRPQENKADQPRAAPVAGGAVRPGAWADEERKAASGSTQIMSREDLLKMAGDYQSGAAEADDNPHVHIGTGKRAGSVVTLRLGQGASEWTIGKAGERDIQLPDEGVSDFHAKIVHQGGRWKIVDQLSTNGTFINNTKVTSGFLNPGDRIKFGAVECVIRFPGQEKAKGTSAGGKNGLIIGAVVAVVIVAAAYFLL